MYNVKQNNHAKYSFDDIGIGVLYAVFSTLLYHMMVWGIYIEALQLLRRTVTVGTQQ